MQDWKMTMPQMLLQSDNDITEVTCCKTHKKPEANGNTLGARTTSPSFAAPSPFKRTFGDLISKWITSWAWSHASPRAMSSAIFFPLQKWKNFLMQLDNVKAQTTTFKLRNVPLRRISLTKGEAPFVFPWCSILGCYRITLLEDAAYGSDNSADLQLQKWRKIFWVRWYLPLTIPGEDHSGLGKLFAFSELKLTALDCNLHDQFIAVWSKLKPGTDLV